MSYCRKLILATVSVAVWAPTTFAEQDTDYAQLSNKVSQLESQVRNLNSENSRLEQTQRRLLNDSGGGVAVFLFGIFCALWAQNTGRNAWLWFFLGLFFNVVTVLFLLAKNADYIRIARSGERLF